MNKITSSILLISFLCSCSRYYLNCDHLNRGIKDLASEFTKAPDPKKGPQVVGEQLVVSWHVPSEYTGQAKLKINLIYWNYTEKEVEVLIHDRLGQYTISNLGDKFIETDGLISYKATILDPQGQVYRSWEHQLYTPIIRVDNEPVELKEDKQQPEEEWDWDISS